MLSGFADLSIFGRHKATIQYLTHISMSTNFKICHQRQKSIQKHQLCHV